MASPLSELLGGAAQGNPQMAQLISMYKGLQNPQQLVNSNPQLKSLLSMYKGDAKSAFYGLCQQRGIDPNTILNMFK